MLLNIIQMLKIGLASYFSKETGNITNLHNLNTPWEKKNICETNYIFPI